MSTILDVARLAGVSRSTVSRVLNESPRVDSETREKVLKAIKRLNFQPSLVARNLRKQETKLIAVLIPNISNPFNARLMEGMEQVAVKNGYNIILCNTGGDPNREIQYLQMLEQKQVDGVILTALRNPADMVKPYLQYGPIVLACEYLDDDAIPAVTIDNIKAARMALEHLIELGHKRIAFINGTEHIILCRDRKRGYLQALENKGIPISHELIRQSDFTIEGGFHCTKDLMELACPPTAIFAANDDMAVGSVKALHKLGLHVPKDVAIVGFDNNRLASVVEPNLTTVDQPIYRIGQEVVNLLLTCLEGGTEMVNPRRITLETKLCIRQSSSN